MQLANGLRKETATYVMILYENKKAMIRSSEGDTDFFDIVSGVLQGDTLASYFFILFLDYELQISINIIKENSFTVKKRRQEAVYIPEKRWLMQTTLMTKHFLQIQ